MAKKFKLQLPTGMHDILPEDQKYFEKIYNVCEKIVDFCGFKRIDTPILEQTDLYQKGTGLTTEIVQKQMFNLKTKGGDCLTLRPEFTPGIIRAYLEHGMHSLPQPIKLYSIGPLFRYERPQAGRFRQFHQFNIEVIGEKSPAIDTQIIQIFYNILTDLKLKKIVVEINSIGDNQCKPYYKKLLVSYFKSKISSLCPDCRRRLKENPLRILDCKQKECRELFDRAPQTIDHLCVDCHSHFKSVLEFLDEIEIPYRLNPYLVRGLDYYTKTVFEIISEEDGKNEEEEKLPTSLIGGGRYDLLVKMLGGEETSAAGGALGIERLINIIKSKGIKISDSNEPLIFLAQLGTAAKIKGLKLLEDFRKNNIQIRESLGRDSLKAQLKIADKIEARYTLLLGQKEALEDVVIVRDMQNGKQETVRIDKVAQEMKKRLKKI